VAELIAPDRAVELVLAHAAALGAEAVPLDDALDRVLATDAVSADAVPGFDNSAMDGYAVRAADTTGATPEAPARLLIAGESRAGHPAEEPVEPGAAARISTGAMLPRGADAVVRVEDTGESGGSVQVYVAVEPGAEIRHRGDDILAGDVVLHGGASLGAAELGVLASIGVAEASCVCKPRLALLMTGDELRAPAEPLRPGMVRNTNAYSIAAQARQAGAHVTSRAIVPDDRSATTASLGRALEADVVIVCGGMSVGRHDHVKPALAELGVEERFWGVALRPGKPTWFGLAHPDGAARPTLVFGLPGNPVSAMITFHLFVRPVLRALSGAVEVRERATAIMDEPYRKRAGRAHAVRCRAERGEDARWHVRPTKEQASHVLTSMLGADALAMIAIEREDVAAGEEVEIELLSRR